MKIKVRKSDYTFVLVDPWTGKIRQDVELALPSVTHIIEKTLAKPELIEWAYRRTVDNISGLVDLLWNDERIEHAEDLIKSLRDAEELDDYLTENRLRPSDVAEDASEAGQEGHAFLAKLAMAALEADAEAAVALAQRTLKRSGVSGHNVAIAKWWLSVDPDVVASEKTVVSTRHRFAGTLDILRRRDDTYTVTDLKCRSEDRPCGVEHRTRESAIKCHVVSAYTSDHLQTGGYSIALAEEGLPVSLRTVLVAKADGTFDEVDSDMPEDLFLNLVELHRNVCDVKGHRTR